MQDKKTLITIVVLLAVFLPATIAGTYRKFTRDENALIDDNPNHDLIYNDKVYFYLNDELVSIYECSNCSEIKTEINDNEYHTNYYKNGAYKLPVVLNKNFALIKENNKNYIYNLLSSKTISGYDVIKNYNVEHTEFVLIVSNNNKWGVIGIDENAAQLKINFDYDYIALPSHIVNGVLDTSKFISMVNQEWYILNSDGTSDYQAFNFEIVDFNSKYYISYENDAYHIMDYNNQEYLSSVNKSGVYAVSDYIYLISNNSLYIYSDCSNSPLKSINLPSYGNIYFNQLESSVEIIIDDNLYYTIELSELV